MADKALQSLADFLEEWQWQYWGMLSIEYLIYWYCPSLLAICPVPSMLLLQPIVNKNRLRHAFCHLLLLRSSHHFTTETRMIEAMDRRT